MSYKDKEWLEDQYITQDKSLRKIGRENELAHSTISCWLKKFNIPLRSNSESQKGSKNHNWKNGRIKSSGYWKVKSYDHPRADRDGYVFEHILVMEEKLGRYLTKDERVHHIDGDKSDNKIENLYLCKNSSDHSKLHNQKDKLFFNILKKGIIKFNKETGEYYYKDT